MNKNWKKLGSLFLSLTCAVAMSVVPAFADTESTPAYLPVEESTLNSMLSTSESLIDELCGYGDEDLEALKTSDYQFTVRAVEAWQSVQDELGALVSYDAEEATYEVDGDFVTCTIPAEFEYNPATVRVYWNMVSQQAQATDMTFTVESSISVLMGEAGMNTVTGLCVVFVVLIFLVVIIFLFGKIGAGSKTQPTETEKKAVTPAPAPAPAPAVNIPAAAAAQDDIELQIVLGMAIAMYEEETGAAGGDSYVVRSIRKNRKNNWKR